MILEGFLRDSWRLLKIFDDFWQFLTIFQEFERHFSDSWPFWGFSKKILQDSWQWLKDSWNKFQHVPTSVISIEFFRGIWLHQRWNWYQLDDLWPLPLSLPDWFVIIRSNCLLLMANWTSGGGRGKSCWRSAWNYSNILCNIRNIRNNNFCHFFFRKI